MYTDDEIREKRLLARTAGLRGAELPLDTARPPLRPVSAAVLGGDDDV